MFKLTTESRFFTANLDLKESWVLRIRWGRDCVLGEKISHFTGVRILAAFPLKPRMYSTQKIHISVKVQSWTEAEK